MLHLKVMPQVPCMHAHGRGHGGVVGHNRRKIQPCCDMLDDAQHPHTLQGWGQWVYVSLNSNLLEEGGNTTQHCPQMSVHTTNATTTQARRARTHTHKDAQAHNS